MLQRDTRMSIYVHTYVPNVHLFPSFLPSFCGLWVLKKRGKSKFKFAWRQHRKIFAFYSAASQQENKQKNSRRNFANEKMLGLRKNSLEKWTVGMKGCLQARRERRKRNTSTFQFFSYYYSRWSIFLYIQYNSHFFPILVWL